MLSRINFARQRVRPPRSLGLAAGVDLLRPDPKALIFEAKTANLTDRINVINFASLFSSTAIGTPRSASV